MRISKLEKRNFRVFEKGAVYIHFYCNKVWKDNQRSVFQVNIELETIYLILEIIVAIIVVIGAIWGVWNYSKKKYEKGYSDGKRDGQKAMQNANFLIKDDEVMVGEDVMKRGNELLDEANSRIKIITVTGAAWMLGETKEIIKKKVDRGVKAQLILIDPTTQAADYVSDMESKFTVTPRPAERVFGNSIRTNVNKIIEIYRNVIGAENIRLYGKPFFWKGSIVDGRKAMYTMFDVPRHDTPLRLTNNELVVKHFEKYFFDEIWKNSRAV